VNRLEVSAQITLTLKEPSIEAKEEASARLHEDCRESRLSPADSAAATEDPAGAELVLVAVALSWMLPTDSKTAKTEIPSMQTYLK
jgi:hypothetical protein